jgi:hypothetical protein
MSRRNGDRSRFDRQRKAKLHNRTRIREFRKMLVLRGSSAPESESKPK